MRLSSRRTALLTSFALALFTVPLIGQRSDSMSARELQRRLEKDTSQLIDSLRSQRNTPSAPSRSGPDPWVEETRARAAHREADRAEKARLDAEWRRDHPNETRQQYFARIDREAASKAHDERTQREAALRARRAREAAEIERQETADWARIRASSNGYAAEVRPPTFPTAADSLAWYLRHESSANNEWAGNQAAMLLIEGIGVPQDVPQAVRLLDPNRATAKKAGTRHPESRALFAYLQLTFADVVRSAGLGADVEVARGELQAAAVKSPLATWYLARALANSADAVDQKRALQLITPGAIWARSYFAAQVKTGPAGRDPIFKHLGHVSISILEKLRAHLPALVRELPLPEFEAFSDLLPYASEPIRTQAMTLYVEAIAERVVPLTPSQTFNYIAFDTILEKAGEAGIDGVDGLATLRRFYLLGIENPYPFKPSWGHVRNEERSLAALTRWAEREDTLGARARLALEGLVLESVSSQWWTPSSLEEVRQYQDATREHEGIVKTAVVPAGSGKSIFQVRDEAENAKKAARQRALGAYARRDAAAPKLAAVPGFLSAMKIGKQWRDELSQLKAADNSVDPAFFAVTHSSFDLPKAETFYDSGLAADTPEILRWHHLFEALRLGDAFAPVVLQRELASQLPRSVVGKLERLAAARLARDEAGKRSRAVLARALMALFQSADDADRVLAEAAATGSPLASRLLLDRRIGNTIARENGRPISWNLDPALIAEYDAALGAGENTGPGHAEWSVVRAVFSDREADLLARNWFGYLQSWIADRDERLGSAAFATAILPQIDAVIATLAQWPGLNQDDPLRAEWAAAAARDREEAQKLVRKNDALGALAAFLAAVGRGDRGALELLARHIRNGEGNLPRSADIADRLQSAAFAMATADAEVGDGFAADYVGSCFRDGIRGVAADPAQAAAWLRYAAELGHPAASRALAQVDAAGLGLTPAEILRWEAVRDATEYEEFLPKPPRRLTAPRIDLATVRPQLEAAAAALAGFRTKKPVELTDAQENAESDALDVAQETLKNDPAKGLVLLANLAAGGSRRVAHLIARTLARGDYGVQPEPALAKRFHRAALGLLERDAEYGDMNAAQRLGLYAFGLDEKPDVAAALHWLSYAAQLGDSAAAERLAQLYTDGAAGIPADVKQAAHWTALAAATESDNFKPLAPLR